jgi:uncharacterized glyoxalase superfamily protein PhnB
MHIARLTVCLQVRDVAAATRFYVDHFGYDALLAEEGFAKLRHANGHELFFLRCGARISDETVPDEPATGVILALEVDDAARELARLRDAGLEIVAPLEDEPWGERLFQVRDPNGITVQLVQWLEPPPYATGAA